MVTVRNRCTQPIVPALSRFILCNVIASKLLLNRIELLHVKQKHLIGNIFVICVFVSVSNRINVGIVGKIKSRFVNISRTVLRVRNDGTLRYRFDGGNLVLSEIA